MKIEHNITGVQDFCINKLEQYDADPDLKPDFKLKAFSVLLQQLRGFAQLDLAHRNLLIKAPAIARDRSIIVPLGRPQLEALPSEPEAWEKEPKSKPARKHA